MINSTQGLNANLDRKDSPNQGKDLMDHARVKAKIDPNVKDVTTKNIDNSKETLNDTNGLQKLLRLKAKDNPSAKLYLQLMSSI